MKSGKFTAKKIAVLAIFITLSLITFIIENQFPPLFVPGARMGLANIFSFTALIMFSPVEAFIVVAVRTGLGAIYAGNVSALLYSFPGGVVSMVISSVLMYTVYPRVSVMAVSVLGAVAHNVTQNIVFVLLTDTSTLTLIPYFILAGILSGAIVGAVTLLLFKKIPMSVFEKTIGQKKLHKLQPEQQQENLNEN